MISNFWIACDACRRAIQTCDARALHLAWTLLLILSASSVFAEDPLPSVERLKSSPVLRHLKPNPSAKPNATGPESTVAQMYVPEGFKVELVAGEPDVQQPVAFAFDERGRIWVAEAYSYPQKQPQGKGLDKIVIFEDRDGDGRFETRKVFAEGLNLVSGFEVGYGGVWVGAAPQLLFIPDRNHDDVPDGPPEVLLEGFGYQDTHECLNSFLWGPDGWLYGNQGVFNYARIGKPGAPENEKTELRAGVWRYHPVLRQFEIFAEGGSNQWGLDFDERGQLWMTHCRSYWGRGPTTHVIQGGRYWNQANANYPAYIVANPPSDFPTFKNYLLSAARYDHGAGGAGVPGSDAIYGGHSHVGTMIYLGDNWPDEFRGHLFTHNLGGHQINQQVSRRLGSGFEIVHAGRDQFFCSDPTYVAVDLQYGPDGAVYMIDWSDQQHCHNPNTEKWDRSNGRIYRMSYEKTWQPKKVDLGAMDDFQLSQLHAHKNEWFVRMARRLLGERAQTRAIAAPAIAELQRLFQSPDPTMRMRAQWTLHGIGKTDTAASFAALSDPDEFVRAWAVQLANEAPLGGSLPATLREDFVRLAKEDPSPVVRLYLASAIQRVDAPTAWRLCEALTQHGEDRDDRNLPSLVWDGLAQRMPTDLKRALAIADSTLWPQLSDWAYWYASTLTGEGPDRVVQKIATLSGEDLRRTLTGMGLAMDARANVAMPPSWKDVAPKLYASKDLRVARQAERLAAVFGDSSMFPRLRNLLSTVATDTETRRHAFAVLSRALDRDSLPVFISLLDDSAFRTPAINLLGRFDTKEIPAALIERFAKFSTAERAATVNALTSRSSFAIELLDAIASGKVGRDQITAFHVRQMNELKNAEVDARLAKSWGKLKQSPVEKQNQIARLEKDFKEAPLWAFDARAGRQHFQKLCSQCHRLGNEGTAIGPELTGAGKNGARYFLENIIDPNAVIGADFQMTTVETKNGTVVTGMIVKETDSAVTVRTTMESVVIAKSDIARRATSELSMMPEGLLDSLNPREQTELLKFLTTN